MKRFDRIRRENSFRSFFKNQLVQIADQIDTPTGVTGIRFLFLIKSE